MASNLKNLVFCANIPIIILLDAANRELKFRNFVKNEHNAIWLNSTVKNQCQVNALPSS
jgi:hypothetical protein